MTPDPIEEMWAWIGAGPRRQVVADCDGVRFVEGEAVVAQHPEVPTHLVAISRCLNELTGPAPSPGAIQETES